MNNTQMKLSILAKWLELDGFSSKSGYTEFPILCERLVAAGNDNAGWVTSNPLRSDKVKPWFRGESEWSEKSISDVKKAIRSLASELKGLDLEEFGFEALSIEMDASSLIESIREIEPDFEFEDPSEAVVDLPFGSDKAVARWRSAFTPPRLKELMLGDLNSKIIEGVYRCKAKDPSVGLAVEIWEERESFKCRMVGIESMSVVFDDESLEEQVEYLIQGDIFTASNSDLVFQGVLFGTTTGDRIPQQKSVIFRKMNARLSGALIQWDTPLNKPKIIQFMGDLVSGLKPGEITQLQLLDLATPEESKTPEF